MYRRETISYIPIESGRFIYILSIYSTWLMDINLGRFDKKLHIVIDLSLLIFLLILIIIIYLRTVYIYLCKVGREFATLNVCGNRRYRPDAYNKMLHPHFRSLLKSSSSFEYFKPKRQIEQKYFTCY